MNVRRLEQVLARGRTVRVVGFDDGPFRRRPGARVPVHGIVCAGTRFEGMLAGAIRRDGFGATRRLIGLLTASKFHEQVHLVLLDGIAMGGFNVIDLPALAEAVARPCVAVMRRRPDLERVRLALERLSHPQRRWATILRAGPVHEYPPFVFQCVGAEPEIVAEALRCVTDTGHVPEALRLAHLIGSALATGQSSRRA